MLEAKAKDQGHNAEVILEKKTFSLQNCVNFSEISSALQVKKCLQKNFCKLSGVLHDETKVVMTIGGLVNAKR